MIGQEINDIPGFGLSNKRTRHNFISSKKNFLYNDTIKSAVFDRLPVNSGYNPIVNKIGKWKKISKTAFESKDILNQDPEKKKEKTEAKKPNRESFNFDNRFGKFFSKEKSRYRKLRRHQSVELRKSGKKVFRIPEAEKMKRPIKQHLKVKFLFKFRIKFSRRRMNQGLVLGRCLKEMDWLNLILTLKAII